MKILVLLIIMSDPFTGRVGPYARKIAQVVNDQYEAATIVYETKKPRSGFIAEAPTYEGILYEIDFENNSISTVPIPTVKFELDPKSAR